MSPIAADGIPVAPGEEAMIAATPAEWVDATATLYENEKRWQSMSSRSLAFAKSNYGFEQGMRLMQQALEQVRSEEHTSELQSLMRTSYAVFCLKTKNTTNNKT